MGGAQGLLNTGGSRGGVWGHPCPDACLPPFWQAQSQVEPAHSAADRERRPQGCSASTCSLRKSLGDERVPELLPLCDFKQ